VFLPADVGRINGLPDMDLNPPDFYIPDEEDEYGIIEG